MTPFPPVRRNGCGVVIYFRGKILTASLVLISVTVSVRANANQRAKHYRLTPGFRVQSTDVRQPPRDTS